MVPPRGEMAPGIGAAPTLENPGQDPGSRTFGGPQIPERIRRPANPGADPAAIRGWSTPRVIPGTTRDTPPPGDRPPLAPAPLGTPPALREPRSQEPGRYDPAHIPVESTGAALKALVPLNPYRLKTYRPSPPLAHASPPALTRLG